MNIKDAAIRGIRTFGQALLGLMLSVPAFKTLLDSEVFLKVALPLGLANAAFIGVISFLQNAVEDNTALDVPKG